MNSRKSSIVGGESLNESESKAPTCQRELDTCMEKMDKIHGTSFYSWLKDDSHLDQIAFHCKRILSDYNEKSLALGLSWLTKDWNASRTAELLIKMFYHWGMSSPKFAGLISHILQALFSEDNQRKADDVLMTLLIGEDAKLTATFVYHVSRTWDPLQTSRVTKMLATRTDWDAEFFQNYTMHFASLLYASIGDESYSMATLKLLQSYFQQADSSSQLAILGKRVQLLSVESDSNTKMSAWHLDYLSTIFEVVLSDFSGSHEIMQGLESSSNGTGASSSSLSQTHSKSGNVKGSSSLSHHSNGIRSNSSKSLTNQKNI